MKSNPGVAADIFEALADAGINIEIISTSSIRVSCVVPAGDAERAVNVIHERLQARATSSTRARRRLAPPRARRRPARPFGATCPFGAAVAPVSASASLPALIRAAISVDCSR